MTAQCDLDVEVICRWCAQRAPVVVVYGWATCELCACSRANRVAAYQARLRRGARQ